MIAAEGVCDESIVRFPEAPRTLAEAGLPFDVIVPLVLKTLHFMGELSGASIAARLGLQ